MKRLSRRLAQLGNSLPVHSHSVFTKEELHVATLWLAMRFLRSAASERVRIVARDTSERLAAEVSNTRVRQATDQFKRHIVEYVQPTWQTRWGRPEYLPPVVGSEYDDWELPGLFNRRLGVRNFPLVVDLVGPPDPTWGTNPGSNMIDLAISELLRRAAVDKDNGGESWTR